MLVCCPITGPHPQTTQSYIKPLSEYGIEVMYDPEGDRISELRKLNQRIMSEFLLLVKRMCVRFGGGVCV
jgi:hypothetical protein